MQVDAIVKDIMVSVRDPAMAAFSLEEEQLQISSSPLEITSSIFGKKMDRVNVTFGDICATVITTGRHAFYHSFAFRENHQAL